MTCNNFNNTVISLNDTFNETGSIIFMFTILRVQVEKLNRNSRQMSTSPNHTVMLSSLVFGLLERYCVLYVRLHEFAVIIIKIRKCNTISTICSICIDLCSGIST